MACSQVCLLPKKRDAETGRGYLGPDFSGAQGRFTSRVPADGQGRRRQPADSGIDTHTRSTTDLASLTQMRSARLCVQDKNCTIRVKVNVLYDKTVNRDRGLKAEQKKTFEQGQIT